MMLLCRDSCHWRFAAASVQEEANKQLESKQEKSMRKQQNILEPTLSIIIITINRPDPSGRVPKCARNRCGLRIELVGK